jgi:uncharacterized protein YecT (DUF1311 family)
MPCPVRILVLLAAILAAVDSGGASAGEGLAQRVLSQPIQKPPANCEAASNRVHLELCAVARFRAADDALNKVFRTITTDANRDDKNKKLLQEAQRQWLRYRDLTCDWQSDNVRGGTAATLYAINCLAEVTEAQAKYLENASGP